MQIPFGEWLPDQPPHLNPGATVATNVYYAVNSYKPFPSLISYSSTAGGGLANIGKDSLIGMNAVVMDDANVGDECIVGALCFIKGEMKELVKNIESYCIKKLTKQTRYCRLYDT